MPLPIRPQPSTPTRLISVIVFPWWLGWLTPGACPGGVEGLSQLLGDAHQWAGARAGQRVLGSDFAPLEPVEHLLERHLDPLVLGAVTPGHEDPGAPEHRAGDEQDRGDEGDRHRRAERHRGAGLLFEQGLVEVALGDADVLAQGEQLVLRQPLADVVLCRLELGRALDDPLERLAADELARHRYASTLLVFGAAGSVSPEALCGSAGAVAWRATESRNPLNRSMGIGKNVVELFSEEISVTVCR